MLKPFQSFGRNRALDLRTVGKAESEKLPFLRSRYRALALIHLEFELLRDESRDAFHHPLTRALRKAVTTADTELHREREPLPLWDLGHAVTITRLRY